MLIRDIKGERVYADLLENNQKIAEIQGTLAYFNFDQPIIHIQDYTITDLEGNLSQGRFIVLNERDWGKLKHK